MKNIILVFKYLGHIDKIAKELENEFSKRGYLVKIKKDFLLSKIEKSFNENIDYTILIHIESLEANRKSNKNYLLKIKEIYQNSEIVYIIENYYYKSHYLRNMLELGIYNGIFKKDASISNIVYICLNPRNKKEAEGYYGLNYSDSKNLKIHNNSAKSFFQFIKSMDGRKEFIVKEKVVYETPLDYKKVISIISPYSTGKTTVAVNLATIFSEKNIKTSIIDTDFEQKDVYCHFDIDYIDCLSKISSEYTDEKIISLGQKFNNMLTIYSEHRDIEVDLDFDDIFKLIRVAKRNAQIVIIDLSQNLNREVYQGILGISDHILLVVNQQINLLNRLPQKLYNYKNFLDEVDLVINRYVEADPNEKDIKKLFKNIYVTDKISFSLNINNIFTVKDDYKSVIQGLAERIPTVNIEDNLLREDYLKISRNYYISNSNKKNNFFNKINNIFNFTMKKGEY
ncbi:nucleotide-binding protein [Paramaledivibacter caminithermalis]|jgi:MinD-like ATPase involved in chromosome partitioning or flagellar assembly|uniref:MinD-like ATPase involved in chromosome partitioning or flagellar assembly n=1 Tax=Paramaledivibacter caminithermalis (strain DSM 15212 / CIP 107654 / DViRD3) TaxID=1121301 RepID=A0A1M6S1C8_PARC5|nr:hypothetical protein [Paramaledivibacter caminithermalis]SHK38399.1 MinD-like ATPase involved in chromosome partitioning or flagellar assembly [Paramaledivibacter caminithermalis DSM 15212]